VFPSSQSASSVLIVEDNDVGSFIRRALAQRGYDVVCAAPDDALTLLCDPQRRVSLLITNTPAAFDGFPDLPLLYVAAIPEPERMRPFQRCRALRKPFLPAQLFASVRELLP
jgi:hypothetical protein